jgi:hypothetical protein
MRVREADSTHILFIAWHKMMACVFAANGRMTLAMK